MSPTHHRETSPRGRRALAALATLAATSALLAPSAAIAATSHSSARLVVTAVKNPSLGTILVSGRPLYTLVPSATPCRSACLKIWPEVVLAKGATRPVAGRGVDAAKLGTVRRPGGVLQVTYAGRPLYWFVGDRPGSRVTGDVTDTWGVWHCVVTAKAAASGTTKSEGSVTTTTKPTTSSTSAPSGGGVGF